MTIDTGHFNCRDYDVSLHSKPQTREEAMLARAHELTTGQVHLYRHESYDELEQRSRSPASQQPKFALLALPLELRQQIYSYLLPRTQDLQHSNPLGSHARNFSAVRKRAGRGMALPILPDTARAIRRDAPSPVVWIKGCTALLSVCKQVHDEAAAMMYGQSTFLLFVTFAGITFRFRWLVPSGMAPTRTFSDFVGMMPEHYRRLIRRVIVHVDHVDGYTGMIKFNTSAQGLVHGYRKQIQRLVLALQPECEGDNSKTLSKVVVRVSNSNATLDMIKALSNTCEDDPDSQDTQLFEDVKEILEPFGDLAGVNEVHISGAVPHLFAQALERRMESTEPRERHACCCDGGMSERDPRKEVPLCVYGNDID